MRNSRGVLSRPTNFALIGVTSLVAVACASTQLPSVGNRPPAMPELEAVVYLIGDAGEATRETPVLLQLKRDVIERSSISEVIVVFLGDNVYDKGLYPLGHPDHEEGVDHLEAQIEVVRGTTAKGVFLSGNHDWGYSDERGLEQIKRQGEYLAAAAAEAGVDVALYPAAGCPGPVLMPVGRSLLLVMLDTNLWLRDELPGPECSNQSTDEALEALRAALRDNSAGDNRNVVVLAHHPLETYGPHGGHYSLKDKIFPATKLWEPLYIPLPFVYPLAKKLDDSPQDLSNSQNEAMRRQFAQVFLEFHDQPLVFAAGHEHSLQVLDGREFGVGVILVSGAGSRLTDVAERDALFSSGKQHDELGYMRLEVMTDGRTLLSVITDGTELCEDDPSCSDRRTVRFRQWLIHEAAVTRPVVAGEPR